MQDHPEISIIIPTYEEKENISPLLSRLINTLNSNHINGEIIIVDDNSPDGTAEEACKYPVKVIVRKSHKGLAAACLDGFRIAQGNILLVMDADLQHPPEKIPDLLKAIRGGADIAIGSRYAPGGSFEHSIIRKCFSKFAAILTGILLNKTRAVKDIGSGFFAITKSTVENVKLTPPGYKILLEILIKGNYSKVVEVGYKFEKRIIGKSKFSFITACQYLWHLLKIIMSSPEKKGGDHPIEKDKDRQKKVKTRLFVCTLIVSIFLLFFNLGHYALWDDEATTAMFGMSVWETGDTSAVRGHNLVAYMSGVELKNLRERYLSPLQFYVVAPFLGLGTNNSFFARLPFALCGMATVLFLFYWLWKDNADESTWILMSLGILGNVSFWLFSRQCRYYALAILFSLLLVYLYCHRNGSLKWSLSVVAVSLLLLASNYINYAALYICLAVDYFIWGKKRSARIGMTKALSLFIPQLILGGWVVSVYNPIGKDIWGGAPAPWWFKIQLFLWNLRELNYCEFVPGLFLAAAPFLFIKSKNETFKRGWFFLIFYCLAVALISPQAPFQMNVAIVRYLAPLIPLGIFLSVLTIHAFTTQVKYLALPLALLTFGTNVLNGGPLAGPYNNAPFGQGMEKPHFRSTITDFVKEIASPPPSAYRITADWIRQNIRPNESIFVAPQFANYPLMYHANGPLYAWQIEREEGQFTGLADIHFFDRVPPDFIIAFGRFNEDAQAIIFDMKTKGIEYAEIGRLDVYWYDLIRPELYWHSFREIDDFSLEDQAIYIYKRTTNLNEA